MVTLLRRLAVIVLCGSSVVIPASADTTGQVAEALAAWQRGDLRRALDLSRQALALEGGESASSEAAASAANICQAAAGRLGIVDQQLSCAVIAERLRRASGDFNHGIALSNLGAALSATGRHQDALVPLTRSVQVLEPFLINVPDLRRQWPGILNNLASAQHKAGDREAAERNFLKARDAARRDPGADSAIEGVIQNNLGFLYAGWPERRERAEGVLREALRIRELNRDPDRGHTHTNLGSLYFDEQRLEESRQQHARAFRLWQERLGAGGAVAMGASSLMARSLFNLGRIAEEFDDRAQALRLYEEALRLGPRDLDPAEVGTWHRARIKSHLGEGAAALAAGYLPSYAAAIRLSSEPSSLAAGWYWLTEAEVARAQGSHAVAEERLRRAANVTRMHSGRDANLSVAISSERVELLDAMGRTADAVAARREALARLPSMDGWAAATAMHNLAWALWTDALGRPVPAPDGRLAEARDLSDAAVGIATRLISPRIPFTCADLRAETGVDLRAAFTFNILINLASQGRQEATIDALAPTPAAVAFRSLQLLDAFDGAWAARGHVRRLLSGSADAQAWDEAVRLDQQRCGLVRLTDHQAPSDAGAAGGIAAEIDRRIMAAVARLSPTARAAVVATSRTYDLAEMASTLAADEALASLVIARDTAFAIIVHRSVLSFRRIEANQTSLRRALSALRESLRPPTPGVPMAPFDVSAARDLHARLLAPVLGVGSEIRTLYLLPDSASANVPWAALSRGTDADGERWLIDTVDLSILPSVQAFMNLRARRVTLMEMSLTALADPTADPRLRLSALPSARREAREVEAVFPIGRRSTVVGSEATEAAFRESRGSVLLIAAHGLSGQPGRANGDPFIALAPDATRGDDGLLTASEIASLDLTHLSLAILSACDTGTVTSARFGAFGGLVQAFLAAGTQSILATQWPVDSAASATLVSTFAEARFRDGVSVGAALRRAMAAVRRDPNLAHPYFWAPFIYVGVSDAGRM